MSYKRHFVYQLTVQRDNTEVNLISITIKYLHFSVADKEFVNFYANLFWAKNLRTIFGQFFLSCRFTVRRQTKMLNIFKTLKVSAYSYI